jgi:hypothetical protein
VVHGPKRKVQPRGLGCTVERETFA